MDKSVFCLIKSLDMVKLDQGNFIACEAHVKTIRVPINPKGGVKNKKKFRILTRVKPTQKRMGPGRPVGSRKYQVDTIKDQIFH